MSTAQLRPTALSLVDCFNRADAMIADVSSVVSDFVYSEKPYAVTAMGALTSAAELVGEFPLARGGYLLGADGVDWQRVLDDLLIYDPKLLERRSLKSYYLGPFPADSYAECLRLRRPAIPVSHPKLSARAEPPRFGWVAAVVPGAVMIGLGVWGLDRGSMWQDESASFEVAHRTVVQILLLVRHVDIVHAAYYLLLHLWMLPGGGEVWMRIPSVLAATSAAATAGAIGARLAGTLVGSFFVGLLFAADFAGVVLRSGGQIDRHRVRIRAGCYVLSGPRRRRPEATVADRVSVRDDAGGRAP